MFPFWVILKVKNTSRYSIFGIITIAWVMGYPGLIGVFTLGQNCNQYIRFNLQSYSTLKSVPIVSKMHIIRIPDLDALVTSHVLKSSVGLLDRFCYTGMMDWAWLIPVFCCNNNTRVNDGSHGSALHLINIFFYNDYKLKYSTRFNVWKIL